MATAAKSNDEQLAVYGNGIYNNPLEMVVTLFGVDPTPQQREILNAVRDNKRVAVCSGHGIGKTSTIAWLIVWWLLTRPNCRVMLTASKESQLKQQVWPEVVKWLTRKLPDAEWQRQADDIRKSIIVEGSTIYRQGNQRSAFAFGHVARIGTPENLQGFHHEHLLQITDETSAISNEHMEAIESTLTEEDNRLYVFSNPTRRTGWFADACKPDSIFKRLQFNSLDSPLVSKEWAAGIAKRYGINSNVYRVRVLGKFPKSDDDSLILYEWIEAAQAREGANVGPIIIGVDPGRSVDGDATGIVARAGDKILHVSQHWINDLMHVAGICQRVRAELKAKHTLPFSHYAVDVIGLGGGVVDALRQQDEPVEAVNVSKASTVLRSDGTKEAAKLRDELWLKVRDWLRDHGSLQNIDSEMLEIFTAELSAPKYKLDSAGAIKVEGKAEMKKRGISSPNLADALCCTFAGAFEDFDAEFFESDNVIPMAGIYDELPRGFD